MAERLGLLAALPVALATLAAAAYAAWVTVEGVVRVELIVDVETVVTEVIAGAVVCGIVLFLGGIVFVVVWDRVERWVRG
jgi:hypothetical protein